MLDNLNTIMLIYGPSSYFTYYLLHPTVVYGLFISDPRSVPSSGLKSDSSRPKSKKHE
jgi:hypothetical protein